MARADRKSYFEIYKDGTFKFVRNSCDKYEIFTNNDYVKINQNKLGSLLADFYNNTYLQEISLGELTEENYPYSKVFIAGVKGENETVEDVSQY